MTPKLLLRTASIAEACTWAILLIGMLVKYALGGTDLIVTIGGSLHGVTFLTFLFTLLIVGINQRFSWLAFALGLLASIPPFTTLLFDWWAERRGMLAGDWRPSTRIAFGDEMTDDDFDSTGVDTSLVNRSPGGAETDVATARDNATGDDGATRSAAGRAATALAAHPADARIAQGRERTAPVARLDPFVRFCVDHPFTLASVGLLMLALIMTQALTS